MAMTGTLKVTPEKLTSTASSFRTQGGAIRNLTSQMLSTVNSLNSCWEGPAQQTYSRKFNALDGDMAQIYLKICEHVKDLIEMANAYQRAEQQNMSTFGSLGTDYIHHG